MTNLGENPQFQPQIDASANSGQEQRITTIPFKDLAARIYKERVAGQYEPRLLAFFFAATAQGMNAPYDIPTIGFYGEPSFIDHSGSRINLLGVDSLHNSRIGNNQIKGICIDHGGIDVAFGPRAEPISTFSVYNLNPKKIGDATVTEDLVEILPDDVQVASTEAEARQIQGWVADPKLRERIIQWMEIKIPKEEDREGSYEKQLALEKFIQLRQAPFNTTNFPQGGRYTYAGVKQEAQFGHKSNVTIGGVRAIEHYFTQEDLNWVETFMTNKGIPIPQS